MKNKRTVKILNIMLLLLILTGLLGGLFRFMDKLEYDRGNSQVAVVMDYEDAVSMTDRRDIEYDMKVFAAAGFSGILMEPVNDDYDKHTLELLRRAGLASGLLPSNEFEPTSYVRDYLSLGATLPLLVLDSVPGSPSLSELSAAGINIARIEGNPFSIPEGYDKTVSLLRFSPVLSFDEESGYDFAEHEQELLGAIVSRGVRVIYLGYFTDENGQAITDFSVYSAFLRGLADSLKPHGITLGADISSEATQDSDVWVLLICLSVCALIVIMLSGLKRIPALAGLIILGVLLAATVVLWLLNPGLCINLITYAAFLLAPALSMYYLLLRCRSLSLSNGSLSVSSVFFQSLRVIIVAALIGISISLAAGLIDFSPGAATKSLVRAMWIFVPLYTAAVSFRLIYMVEDATLGEYLVSLYYAIFKKKARSVAILLILVTVILLYLFVIRTAPDSLSDYLGVLITKVVPVYPPASEYLLGYPAMAVALVLCSRRMKNGAWAFFMLSGIPASSVAACFSNAALPLGHKLLQAFTGLALGFAFALIIGLILSVIIYQVKLRPKNNWHIY